MRPFPRFVRKHARILCATLAACSIAVTTLYAQLGTYDSSFDGELWTVKQDLAPESASPGGAIYVNGTLFVADWVTNTIYVYDSSGQPVSMPAGAWTGVPDLNFFALGTAKVSVDGVERDAILVSDESMDTLEGATEFHNRVAAFDTTGQHLFTLRIERPTNDVLYAMAINQMALAPGSQFELTTGATPSVHVTGTFVAGWTEQWLEGSVHSGALAYRDTTFVESNGEFQATGATVLDGTSLDPVMPAAINIFGVAFDQNGNLYLSDSFTERLHMYGPDLIQRFSFGTPTPDLKTAEFNEPWGLVFWPDATGIGGRLFIADTNKSTIEVYQTVDANSDGAIDGLQFLYPIDNLIHQPGTDLWPFALAIDDVNNRIAMTDWSTNHIQVVGFAQLAAFNVQLLDGSDAPIDTVCTAAAYKVRFSLTVTAGSSPVTDVVPALTADGIAIGSPSGPVVSSLAAGEVATYTYTLPAPATVSDIALVAGATASNTTDISPRAVTATVANCGADTGATTFTVTPSHPAQVSGWTPIYSATEQYSITVTAHDPDLVDMIEYTLSGANESGYQAIRTEFADGSDNSVTIPLPNFGRTTVEYRARDAQHFWSPWQTLVARPKLVVDRNTNENVAVEFRIGDPEGDGFTYTATGVPPGVSFSTTTGQFAGVISFDANDPYSADPVASTGVYHVVVTEHAPGGTTSDAGFTWTINHVNRSPSITNPPISGLTIKQGDAFNLQINGFDPDGDPVIYTIQGLGANTTQDIHQWLSIDPITGLITGTFGETSDSLFSISVGLAECGEVTTAPPCNRPIQPGTHLATLFTFDVGVQDANFPPDITTPGSPTSAEGDTVSLLVPHSDVENDPLEFTIGGQPPGLTIDPATGVISGTVAYNSARVYAVTVDVTDHHHPKRSVTFDWTITHTNRPPDILASDKFNLDGATVDGFVSALDPDGDTVTFTSATGLPPGVSMDSHGAFTGTIVYGSYGVYSVTVTATDGAMPSTKTFTWTVQKINLPPDIVLPDRLNLEGDVVDVQFQGTDPDHDHLTYSGIGWPAGLTLDPNTGRITGTLGYDTAGVYTTYIGVSDGLLAVLKSFTWTVTNTNRAPNITAVPDRTDSENDSPLVQVSAVDPDGDTGLVYSATNLPPGISINPATGVISGTLTYNATGTYTVTVSVTDGDKPASVTFTWQVLNVNRPPVVTAPDRFNAENDTVSYSLTTSDPDGDPLTFSAVGLPPGIAIDPSTGALSGHLDFNSAGVYHPSVVVNDGTVSVTQPFNWTVTDVNRPPVVTPVDQHNVEGDAVSYQVAASDPDGDAMVFNITGLPTGLTFDPSTGFITGSLGYNTAGSYPVTVVVSDVRAEGSLSVTNGFVWTIANTNRAPEVTAIPDRQDSEGDTRSFAVVASDPDGEVLQFSAVNLPAGISIDPVSGVISGTLTYAAAGDYVVGVTVSDGTTSRTVSFNWKVLNVNRPPTLSAPDRANAENDDVNYPATASDPDGDSLTFTATGLPPGISINASTGALTGHLDYHSAGVYPVSMTVGDGSVSVTSPFVWTVTNVNVPPTVDNPGNLTDYEGQMITRQFTASDPDEGDTLTFSATGLPVGLTMSPSGLVTGMLPYTAAGAYTVTLTVSDGATSRSVTFTWTIVNVNRPPDVLNPGPQTSGENTTVMLPIAAIDPDGDPLTYTAAGLPPGLSINPSSGVIGGYLNYSSAGTYTVTVSASDPGGLFDVETFTWIVNNMNRPPVAGNDSTSVTQGQSVVINVLANDSDADGDAVTVASVTPVLTGQGSVAITNGGTTVTFTATPSTFIGVATFNYTISDGHGGTATATVTVNVQSANTPPVCTAAYGGEIWPPNHKRFYIAGINGVTDPDGDAFTIKIDAILQDERLDSTGDGKFSPDGYVQGGQAWVRAERNGAGNKMPGNGRVYEIFFTATDTKGGSCQGSVFWTVPHDKGQRATAIDSGVRYDSTGTIPGTIDKSLIHQKSPQP